MNSGIITKALGGFFFVADKTGNIHKTRIRGRIQEKIFPGDKVGYSENVIEEVYPRKNLLHRPSVANVDQVGVVQSLTKPTFDRKLLDRFLVIIEAQNLTPIIIINKIDEKNNTDIKEPNLTDYKTAGYDICKISAKNETKLDQLKIILQNEINVLTGPSGVGKSTIINALIEEADMRTGEVSQRLNRGVNTTRHVELLNLDNGGWLADTPGFTSLDIDGIDPTDLRYLYPEFNQYLGHCKFNSCSHTHEPDCAVKKAVKEGELSQKRYRTYKKFYQELT